MSRLERPLELPFTGQALRLAVERRDIHALMAFSAELRVAGYRVEPQRLTHELLMHGCTWILDAFGHRVPLQVHVPTATVQLQPDESQAFRIAA
jgi:hypothetical protein